LNREKKLAKGSLLVGGTCEVAARRGGSWSFSAPFVTKNFSVFGFASRKFSETQREIEEQNINHFLFLLEAGSGTPRSHLISNQCVQLYKKQKLSHWKQEKKWFHRIITSTCGCWIYDVDAPENELVGTHLQATSGLLGPMSQRMRYKPERKQMAEKYKLSYT
jgi:hypothetical protein